jgi:hypothetical protein
MRQNLVKFAIEWSSRLGRVKNFYLLISSRPPQVPIPFFTQWVFWGGG